MTKQQDIPESQDENKLIAQRREKLSTLRQQGEVFPNTFRRDALAAQLHTNYDKHDNAELEKDVIEVSVAGRMMSKRIMGKNSFVHLQDMSGRIQLFIQRDALPGRFIYTF